jgi:orotate phosphoribosyltransferase
MRSSYRAFCSALCVIDRSTGGKDALAGAGLPLKALFTFSQIEGDA